MGRETPHIQRQRDSATTNERQRDSETRTERQEHGGGPLGWSSYITCAIARPTRHAGPAQRACPPRPSVRPSVRRWHRRSHRLHRPAGVITETDAERHSAQVGGVRRVLIQLSPRISKLNAQSPPTVPSVCGTVEKSNTTQLRIMECRAARQGRRRNGREFSSSSSGSQGPTWLAGWLGSVG